MKRNKELDRMQDRLRKANAGNIKLHRENRKLCKESDKLRAKLHKLTHGLELMKHQDAIDNPAEYAKTLLERAEQVN